MVNEFEPARNQERTVQSLAYDALTRLTLVERIVSAMHDSNLISRAEDAKGSAEELVSSLKCSKEQAIENYEEDLKEIEKDLRNTDWDQY